MNIALFSDSYIPTKSGVVTVVVQLRKILEEMGHHVVVVTVGKGRPECEDGDPNVLRSRCVVLPHDKGQYFGLPSQKEIIPFLKEHNIQLIHAHTEFKIGGAALKAGKKLGIPVIATTHTMWEQYYKYYLKVFFWLPKFCIRMWVKYLYKDFYAFINVSEKAHDYYKMPFMLPQIPSAIIPNAIDSKRFISHEATFQEKAELRKQLNISESDKIVLYVGRIVEEKRIDELLVVLKRVVDKTQNVKVLFVGAGARLQTLKKCVAGTKYEDKIIFTGFVDWTKLYIYYSLGDVFVTTSLSEMHSMTILEALNLGIPVVCRYDTSFSDTVFNGENGYFAYSDEEMDDLILKIVMDEQLNKKMRQAALDVASRFSLELHGKRSVAFYEQILSAYPAKVSDEQLKNAVSQAV